MKKLLWVVAAVLLPAASAATVYTFQSSTTHWVCQGGHKLTVTLVDAWKKPGPSVNGTASVPQFLLLGYLGQQYGLAQATSASGARYASLYGPAPADAGLEWWEHQGEATLSRFTGKVFSATAPLLKRCKRS